MRDGAPQGRRFEWVKEGEQRTQLLRRGVAELLTGSSEEYNEQIISGWSAERSPALVSRPSLKCPRFQFKVY